MRKQRADEGTRTRNPLLTRQVLYQLSYASLVTAMATRPSVSAPGGLSSAIAELEGGGQYLAFSRLVDGGDQALEGVEALFQHGARR